MKLLLDLIYDHDLETWSERANEAFAEIFGTGGGRYAEKGSKLVQIRAPKFADESNVPFSTLIEPSNPKSGPYGGLTVGIFPVPDEPCLIALGTGTAGLHPDEGILARPGHARKANAICQAINKREKRFAAWAKHDPTRTDLPIPKNVIDEFETYSTPLKRYANNLHAIYRPTSNRAHTEFVLKAFIDLFFEERGLKTLAAHKAEYEAIQSEYFQCIMPDIEENHVAELLNTRRFVVIEGPPGTGKTRMALQLMQKQYKDRGASIQFHPNTTYENFVGGLSPTAVEGGMGFRFTPTKGELLKAAAQAEKCKPKPYLLHIDEINRADLSKVLGEAVFLLEYGEEQPRTLTLPHDFGPPSGNSATLPANLHILGTMNSADRSIAIVDVAIRRRFAFVKLWPQFNVVSESGSKTALDAYTRLLSVFVEYASDDAFALMPGHSYFLSKSGKEEDVLTSLRVNLLPLLEEYIAQGYVASFADHIRAYCDWIGSLSVTQ